MLSQDKKVNWVLFRSIQKIWPKTTDTKTVTVTCRRFSRLCFTVSLFVEIWCDFNSTQYAFFSNCNIFYVFIVKQNKQTDVVTAQSDNLRCSLAAWKHDRSLICIQHRQKSVILLTLTLSNICFASEILDSLSELQSMLAGSNLPSAAPKRHSTKNTILSTSVAVMLRIRLNSLGCHHAGHMKVGIYPHSNEPKYNKDVS